MKEFGKIIVHRTANINNTTESLTYEWQGPSVTILDLRHISGPESDGLFHIGPYRLRILERYLHSCECKVVRVDYPFWRLVVFAHWFSKLLRIMGARMIITLAVWDMADFNPACVPSWRDIKIIKKLIAKS